MEPQSGYYRQTSELYESTEENQEQMEMSSFQPTKLRDSRDSFFVYQKRGVSLSSVDTSTSESEDYEDTDDGLETARINKLRNANQNHIHQETSNGVVLRHPERMSQNVDDGTEDSTPSIT